jgi:hypothetical protein
MDLEYPAADRRCNSNVAPVSRFPPGVKILQRVSRPFEVGPGSRRGSCGCKEGGPRSLRIRFHLVKLILGYVSFSEQVVHSLISLLRIIGVSPCGPFFLLRGFEQSLCGGNSLLSFCIASGI